MTTFNRDDGKPGSSPSSSSTSSSASGEKELQISAPQSVVHSGHVGFSSNGLQLSGSSVPPELRLMMARLDQKLTSMGATQLTAEEQDAVLRRMLAGPRTTAKPGQVAKYSSSPSTATTATTSTMTAASEPTKPQNISAPIPAGQTSSASPRAPARGPTANAINTESLKMLTALLKERDDRIRDLETELRTAKSVQHHAPAVDTAKFAEEKRVLLQQKRDLEQQLSQLKAKQNVAATRGSIAPNEINKLVEERVKTIQAQSTREIEALKSRLAALEKERDDLTDAKAKLEVELSRAKTAAANRVVSVAPATASNNNAQVTAELKRVEAELSEVRNRLKASESDREKLESSKRALQSQVDSLHSQLSTKDSKSSEAEAAAFQAKLNELSASHAIALEKLRGETQTQHEQIVKLQQQLRDAELSAHSAKAAQSNSHGEMNSFREAMQKELDSARSESAHLEKAKAAMEKAKDALHAKLDEITAALGAEKEKGARETESQTKLSKRIQELESTLTSRTKEHQSSLDAVKATLASVESEANKAKSEISSLKSQLEVLHSTATSSSELAALEDQLQTALAEAKQAQARLASANADKERSQKSNADLESKMRQLAEELQNAKLQTGSESVELAAEVAALEKEMEKERNLKNRLEDEKDVLETNVAQLKAKLNEAGDSTSRYETQLKEARKELDVLRQQLAALEDAAIPSSSPSSSSLSIGGHAPPPPPAPAPPPPSSSTSSSARASPAGTEMNKSLLDSIKNPDVVLKRTSQMLKLPSDVTDGDDILSALARRIIDRRGRMKGGSSTFDPDDLDEEDW